MAAGTSWKSHVPSGVDPAKIDLLAAGSLPNAWSHRWRTAPDHLTAHDPASGWATAAELDERTRQVAGRLVAAGLIPGDRVLMSASTSLDLVVAHVGALRAGLVVVPANTGYRERELAHLVADAKPKLAVVDDPARGGWILGADPSVIVTSSLVELADGDEPAHLDQQRAADPALLAYTSGTTGAPKGALLSHGNLLASAEALRIAWRWTPEDRLVLPLPLFHLHGLGVGLHGTLLSGASVVLHDGFDPGRVLDAIADHHGSLFFGVPTHWSRLLASGRGAQLRRLRLGVSGSAPLDASLHHAIAAETGHQLIERYGMTETVMNVSNPYDGERRAGTVGLPLPMSTFVSAKAPTRSSCAGPTSSTAIGVGPKQPQRPLTASGSPPATWANSIPTGTCASWAGARISSSRAGTTCTHERWKTCCGRTRRWATLR